MSVSFSSSTSSQLRRGLTALLLSTLAWAQASPALADDEFRLGQTLLLGVVIAPPSSP